MQRCEGGGEARTTAAARGRCSSSSTGNVYWAGWARGAREEAERTCRMLPARPVCRLPHLRDVRGQGSSRSERAGESRHDFTRRLVPLTLPLLGNNGLAPCMCCAKPTRRQPRSSGRALADDRLGTFQKRPSCACSAATTASWPAAGKRPHKFSMRTWHSGGYAAGGAKF